MEKIGHAREWDGLYYLEALSQSIMNKDKLPYYFVSESFSSNKMKVWLYHCPLGHPSLRVIKILFPSLFKALDVENFDCEVCEVAKHKRVSFPISSIRSYILSHLIQSDI